MPTKTRPIHFAICLNAEAGEDVRVGKVYRILPDAKAAAVGCLRVVDESGEDYLYPARRFMLVNIPPKARGRLLKAVKSESTLANR